MIELVALALRCTAVKGTQKLVLIALCNRANDAGVCWPSRKTLAIESGASERHITSLASELVDKGLIRRKTDPRGERSNRYQINVEALRKAYEPKSKEERAEDEKRSAAEWERTPPLNRAEPHVSGTVPSSPPPRTPERPGGAPQFARGALPRAPGIVIEPSVEPKPLPSASHSAGGDAQTGGKDKPAPKPKPAKAPKSDTSGWVRTLFEDAYAKKYNGVKPPWSGRHGTAAQSVAGVLQGTVKARDPSLDDDGVRRQCEALLTQAIGKYLAIDEATDRFVVSQSHDFVYFARRLPQLIQGGQSSKRTAKGTW